MADFEDYGFSEYDLPDDEPPSPGAITALLLLAAIAAWVILG